MPDFTAVAAHFDNTTTRDAYTGVVLFKAQFNTFDESAADGSVVKKRTMSTRPGIAMPARRVIEFVGEQWIVGDGNTDDFFDTPTRSAYWMKKATDLALMLTPGEAVLNSPGTQIYIHRQYLKDTVNGMSDGEYDPFWSIFVSVTEPVTKGMWFRAAGLLYRVRSTHLELNGLTLAASDELDSGAEVSVSGNTGTLDLVTQTWSGGPAVHPGIMLDSYKLYELHTDMDPKYHSGDMTLVVATNDFVVGTPLTIDGQQWSVLAKTQEMDAWNLHIRRQ